MNKMRKYLAVLLGGAVVLVWPVLALGADAIGFSQSANYNSLTGVLTYTINWASATGSTDLIVTDTLPGGTTFVSASGNGQNSGNTVTWDLGAQGAGSSGTLTLTVSVDAAQALNLWANNVVNFMPGTDKAGNAVVSDAAQSLGQNNSQFTALGFGGKIVLAFPWPIMQDSGS